MMRNSLAAKEEAVATMRRPRIELGSKPVCLSEVGADAFLRRVARLYSNH